MDAWMREGKRERERERSTRKGRKQGVRFGDRGDGEVKRAWVGRFASSVVMPCKSAIACLWQLDG